MPADRTPEATRHLPTRDLVDVRLADALGRPGCPACRGRLDAEARFLDAWLYERVQDVRTRRELDESRGLCDAHIHGLLAADRERAGGGLGTAILYESMLRLRLHEVVAAHHERGGRGRKKKLTDAAAAPRCMVCREAMAGERLVLSGLLAHLGDPAWAAAIATAPFCLGHLRALMEAGSGDPRWMSVEQRQIARLHTLADRLRSFSHHSSHDRRHLRTPDEEASVDEGASALGGERRPTR
ncbi:MAG: hypothetical protein U0869_05315 [Chloroflexota bacterium]